MAKKFCGWLYTVLFTPGWQRWVLLAVALAAFLCAGLFLTGGTDYREDPSALVPRSVQAYVETNDLDALLRNAGAWSAWQADRRASPGDQYNRLQVDIAERIGRRVSGLGTRPLRWLVGTGRAAHCVNREEDGGETWALFLQVPDIGEALSEASVEQSMTLETIEGTRENGLFKLTGSGGGELFLCALSPWFIVSSGETLPRFALESVRRPAFSLANSGILPQWTRGASIRGVVNPAYPAGGAALSAYGVVSGWMAAEARVNFVSAFRNGLETTLDTAMLTDKVRGGGLLWPLLRLLLLFAALACLFLAVVAVLVMVGWGGWLKARAARAGIVPLQSPKAIEPSAAFREDAGLVSREETGEVDSTQVFSHDATSESNPGMVESTLEKPADTQDEQGEGEEARISGSK